MAGYRRVMGTAAAVAAVPALLVLPIGPAAAASAPTPSVAGQVPCSTPALVTAISQANAAPGPTTLTLSRGCVYELAAAASGSYGLPVVTGNLTIAGRGATVRRAPTAAAFRIVRVNDAARLTLSDLTLSGGLATDCPNDPFDAIVACGGGVENFGTLTMNGGAVTNDTATSVQGGVLGVEGGGIENFGVANVTGTVFTSDTAGFTGTDEDTIVSGGAISNEGSATLDKLVMRGNVVSATGSTDTVPGGGEVYGAALVNWSEATLTSSTIDGNRSATFESGSSSAAVVNLFGDLTIKNSVVSRNTADAPGGAAVGAGVASLGSAATLGITGSSVTANRATATTTTAPPVCAVGSTIGSTAGGAGLSLTRGSATISDTSVAGNVATSTGGCGVVRGGGILDGGTMQLTRVAVIGNVATGDLAYGGGIRHEGTGPLTATQSTVSGNAATGPTSAGGGISNSGNGTVTLIRTPVVANRPDDCNPTIATCSHAGTALLSTPSSVASASGTAVTHLQPRTSKAG